MKRALTLATAVLCTAVTLNAQSELYPQHFDLEEVTLTNSPLKTAQDLNFETLLSYNHYRLLTPYVRQAGLTTGTYASWESTHPSFPNWGSSDFNLDGHVGGHYLTALALAYAACHDSDTKVRLKERMDYMVSVMKDCQDAYDENTDGLKGFIGGQPMNDAWRRLYSGTLDLRGTGKCEVPWYCQHKIMAGLRDAYIYGGNEMARTVFLKLCDWAILVTSNISDDQMETMLNTEHGGVNEVLLDAYKLTNEDKYLTAAKRFTHKMMLNGMQTLNTTFLDNKHANTQVPKYIGMERICEEDNTATTYQTAAENFWQDVAQNRTLCIGGNSYNEAFQAASAANRYIDYLNGPESCNTNNMLKLSEMLSDRTHNACYADFYEYGMWNHILSTQDPTTGQYVYFTSLRPQSYRIYSTLNESMWCCVGTGMENHSKYGHFIYTHDGTSALYVNLFTPSTLESTNFKLTQTTNYPFADESTITVRQAGTYTIALRHPAWTTGDYKVYINNVEQSINASEGTASYVNLNRTWAEGDVIRVVIPMQLRYTTCPNYTDYISFQYGPILLAAQTSTDNSEEATASHLLYEAELQNEYGHEGRMDHSPDNRASKLALTSAPLLIGERDGEDGVLSKITTTNRSLLTFSIDASRQNADSYTWQTLTLKPFYQIHHARYSCYWYQQTAENFANSSMAAEETAAAAIETRTLDFVATGEQQSEAGHDTYHANSSTGTYNNEYYRDATSGGYIQYTLSYEGDAIESGLSVLCRFTQADGGRKATLYIDDTPIANIHSLKTFNGTVSSDFYNVEFPIPAALMRDAEGNVKQSFVVKLSADKGTAVPGLYYMRLMKDYDANLPANVTTTAGQVRNVIDAVTTGENGQNEMAHGFTYTGSNSNSNHGTYQSKYWRNALNGEYYAYDLSTNSQTEGVSLVVEYWAGDGNRLCNIDIDGVTIATQELNSLRSAFLTFEYPIDPILLEGKEKVNVKFTSAGNKTTPGTYNIYLTTGRTARTLPQYTFINSNFEKNGNDGKISSVSYNDGAIQLTASATGSNALNMRMKHSTSGTYGLNANQYLLTIVGQNLSTTASLWWLMGCNHGASDAPTYTYTIDGSTCLVWDLRKISNLNDAEKNARFIGSGEEIPLSTASDKAYSLLCFGLTSSADDGSATITDISFYSPDQLVDRYTSLMSNVNSMATSLATDSVFAFGNFVYRIANATQTTVENMLSTGNGAASLPSSVFGYTVTTTNSEKAALNKTSIMRQGGNATWLVTNADCNNGDGWTTSTGATASTWGSQSWRGTGDSSDKYLDVGGTLSYVQQSLAHMPAGYYKLVAALRTGASSNSITPCLNETAGSAFNGMGFGSAGSSMINTQGVQMPADESFNGFGSNSNTRGWQWGSVVAQHTSDGTLTVRFNLAGGNNWKCVDDVHLYYSETADGFYQITDSYNDLTSNTKVVGCNIVLTNPNTIVSSDEAIITASGNQLNNNLVSGNVANLVLFDGNEFTATGDFTATQATLYRSINLGESSHAFATVCAPFAITGGATGTFFEPTSLNDGTLTFGAQPTPQAGKPYLLKATAAVTTLTGSGEVKATPVDNGTGVTMKGTFANIASVNYNDYVLSGSSLYKVNSTVSLAPFRAYFTIPGAEARSFSISFDDETTGISAAPAVNNNLKANNAYDLQGRPVTNGDLPKGIYIVGGKKVVVK